MEATKLSKAKETETRTTTASGGGHEQEEEEQQQQQQQTTKTNRVPISKERKAQVNGGKPLRAQVEKFGGPRAPA